MTLLELDRPYEDPTEDIRSVGCQHPDEAFVHPPLMNDSVKVPGLFDEELGVARDFISATGAKIVGMAFDIPPKVFGWFFEDERPWWK